MGVDMQKTVQVPEDLDSGKKLLITSFCKNNDIDPNEIPRLFPSKEQTKQNKKKTEHEYHMVELETINITDLIIVVFCSIALLIATFDRYSDVVYTIVGGFMGYLGGGARGLIRRQNNLPNTETTSKTTTTTKN